MHYEVVTKFSCTVIRGLVSQQQFLKNPHAEFIREEDRYIENYRKYVLCANEQLVA